MPKSKEKHKKRYSPPADLPQRLGDVKQLLKTIKGMKFHHGSTQKRMFNRVIWLAVELSGNFCCRYRSSGVIERLNEKIQRDHVFPRKILIKALQSEKPDFDMIVEQAMTCCVVTMDEHHRLSKVNSDLVGWERYKAAEVGWHDMQTYCPPNIAVEET